MLVSLSWSPRTYTTGAVCPDDSRVSNLSKDNPPPTLRLARETITFPGLRPALEAAPPGLTAPLTATIQMTDVVPDDLAYVTDIPTATASFVGDGAAPTLTCTGTLSETPAVTITYAATLTTS